MKRRFNFALLATVSTLVAYSSSWAVDPNGSVCTSYSDPGYDIAQCQQDKGNYTRTAYTYEGCKNSTPTSNCKDEPSKQNCFYQVVYFVAGCTGQHTGATQTCTQCS